ncbi:MAG: hypothetical protein ACLULM_00865 [Acutalibacter sp.]
MVERLAHFLTGWVEFEVRGNGPRFFNTAAKAGVEFWGFSRQGAPSARVRPGITHGCGSWPGGAGPTPPSWPGAGCPLPRPG